jgi:PAS domain S-box-containing protein
VNLTFLLVLSVLLQFIAAFLALKLIRITRKTAAWILIATAIFFMIFRRGFDLFYLLYGKSLYSPQIEELIRESIAFTTSLLLAIGVAKIAPLFLSIKRSQEAVERLRRENESILNSAGEGIIWLDLNGNHKFVNKTAAQMLGYEVSELIGKPPHGTWHHSAADGSVYSREECPICKSCRDGVVYQVRNEVFWRKDGTSFPVSYIVTPMLENEKLVGAVVTFKDISEVVMMEEALQKTADELAKSNTDLQYHIRQVETANKDLESFSYSVSHDLRAPLRHIDGYVELLQKNASSVLDEKSLRYLSTISESAKRMGLLIDDLLTFSRIGQVEIQKTVFKLEPLIEEVLKDLQSEIQGREITWGIGPLPDVYGDRFLIKLVFQNLISNAIKFTSPCAQARIEIGTVHDKEDETVVFVRDNGVGFDMKYADKLFGVFQRLHSAGQFDGTGIGLANVQRIIHRHGGKTWAEGSVDRGATFYLSIPKIKKGE